MIWSLGADDHNGKSCHQGKFPLLSTISSCLGVSSIPSTTHFTQLPFGTTTSTSPGDCNNGKKYYLINNKMSKEFCNTADLLPMQPKRIHNRMLLANIEIHEFEMSQ